jgi:hypothetical protein
VRVEGFDRRHADCFMAGKPLHESSFTPRAAARAVPDRLTVRVRLSAAGGKPLTLFLTQVGR